ncbi:MAG: AI-2E family transporter [Rhodospirillaceae bacterium]|nr:AI-2E family transporter [Rhodospirillaceae bacterium]
MIKCNRSIILLICGALVLGALYFLSAVLLPFIIGMGIAYFLDPVVDRLEKLGWKRAFASIFVLVSFLVIASSLLLLLTPIIIDQLKNLSQFLPSMLDKLKPYIESAAGFLNNKAEENAVELPTAALFKWSTQVLTKVIDGGFALVNVLSLIFITPVVAFYLLRDWDLMISKIHGWIPLDYKDVIRVLFMEIDESLAAFVRGQGSICLILAAYYAASLTVAGLDFGLIIGLFAGIISFIPFVGAAVGGVLSIGLSLIQFDSWFPIAIIAGIFLVGQILEGNFLTPKLIGEAVGLHPVWVIFALFSGGALFGFLGVIIALPLAAVIGVFFRFGLRSYLTGSFYGGGERKSSPDSRNDTLDSDLSC